MESNNSYHSQKMEEELREDVIRACRQVLRLVRYAWVI